MLRKIEAKVLIVDDLPENLLALRSLIQSEDRTLFQASSADEALSLLLEHEFALAILDVKMPGMNGFELAELMRGTETVSYTHLDVYKRQLYRRAEERRAASPPVDRRARAVVRPRPAAAVPHLW